MNLLLPASVTESPGEARRVAAFDPSLTTDALVDGDSRASGPRLWWLGQAGFALRVEDQVLLVDPYLSDTLAAKYAGTVFPHTRLHPSPVAPGRLRGVVGVLHTHAHTDHMDPGTIGALRDRPTATFVAPRARRSTALERGIPETGLVAVDAGETVTIGRFTITAVPAAHEELTRDEDGAHHFLGYVIDTGTVRIYHSGDCVPYPGQAELLSTLRVDLALLPINGRDAHRLANGVPGNFFLEEAVWLCRDAGIPALIGHHFGLFDFNTISPAHAVDVLTATATFLEWTVPAVGAGFRLNRPAPTTSSEESR